MKNKLNNTLNLLKALCLVSMFAFTLSCDFDVDLPDTNSQEDTILPNANFTFAQDVNVFQRILFQNLSIEATGFEWDFGTGDISNEQDPIYVFEDGEGTYTVSLTAFDANGATSTFSESITVIEPEVPNALIPTIFEASFEDNALPSGGGDGRDSWRNDIGGVIQITSSPVFDGNQASKYPTSRDRVAYQTVPISPNTEYRFDFVYTLDTGSNAEIVFSVLAGGGHTSDDVAGVVAFLASKDAAFITAETVQVGGGQALGI